MRGPQLCPSSWLSKRRTIPVAVVCSFVTLGVWLLYPSDILGLRSRHLAETSEQQSSKRGGNLTKACAYPVGEHIEALYTGVLGGKAWYDAKIASCNSTDNTYTVNWADGDTMNREKTASEIRVSQSTTITKGAVSAVTSATVASPANSTITATSSATTTATTSTTTTSGMTASATDTASTTFTTAATPTTTSTTTILTLTTAAATTTAVAQKTFTMVATGKYYADGYIRNEQLHDCQDACTRNLLCTCYTTYSSGWCQTYATCTMPRIADDMTARTYSNQPTTTPVPGMAPLSEPTTTISVPTMIPQATWVKAYTDEACMNSKLVTIMFNMYVNACGGFAARDVSCNPDLVFMNGHNCYCARAGDDCSHRTTSKSPVYQRVAQAHAVGDTVLAKSENGSWEKAVVISKNMADRTYTVKWGGGPNVTLRNTTDYMVQFYPCSTGNYSLCKRCQPPRYRFARDQCSSCNLGYRLVLSLNSFSYRSCQLTTCVTGSGSGCKVCRRPSERTADDQCATCNSGYYVSHDWSCQFYVYLVGDEVEALRKADGAWHTATIKQHNGHGSYRIYWHEGTQTDTTKTITDLRRKEASRWLRLAGDRWQRLVGDGSTSVVGRLELFHRGEWGTVSGSTFSNSAAKIACRTLGLSGGNVVKTLGFGLSHTIRVARKGSGKIWLGSTFCKGNENSLLDCNRSRLQDHSGASAHHSHDVSIACEAALQVGDKVLTKDDDRWSGAVISAVHPSDHTYTVSWSSGAENRRHKQVRDITKAPTCNTVACKICKPWRQRSANDQCVACKHGYYLSFDDTCQVMYRPAWYGRRCSHGYSVYKFAKSFAKCAEWAKGNGHALFDVGDYQKGDYLCRSCASIRHTSSEPSRDLFQIQALQEGDQVLARYKDDDGLKEAVISVANPSNSSVLTLTWRSGAHDDRHKQWTEVRQACDGIQCKFCLNKKTCEWCMRSYLHKNTCVTSCPKGFHASGSRTIGRVCQANLFVVDGHCTVQDGCMMSPDYPSHYKNHDSCSIRAPELRINAIAFDTESGSDTLHVNGRAYSGRTGPENVLVNSSLITWSTDGNGTRSGWKLCEADFRIPGIRVWAKSAGSSWWFGATIMGYKEGLYTIKWADGAAWDRQKTESELQQKFPEVEQRHHVGEVVAARSVVDGCWLPATIERNRGSFYQIRWADGGVADRAADRTKIPQDITILKGQEYHIGQTVEAKYLTEKSWLRATITGCSFSFYRIRWDSVKRGDTKKMKWHGRLRLPGQRFLVGQAVLAMSTSFGSWFEATIRGYNGTSYWIKWNDGDENDRIKKTADIRKYHKASSSCVPYYPICDEDQDCVIPSCKNGCNNWSIAPNPLTLPSSGGHFNYIGGYDGYGTHCTGDYQAEQSLKVKFSPGKLGWEIRDATVTAVSQGQAQKQGVKVGMRMTRIGGQQFSLKLLQAKVSGTEDYEVEFIDEALPGGVTRGDRVESLIDFSSAAGTVRKGEVGTVAGKGTGDDARRVKVVFPSFANLNLLPSQFTKLEALHKGDHVLAKYKDDGFKEAVISSASTSNSSVVTLTWSSGAHDDRHKQWTDVQALQHPQPRSEGCKAEGCRCRFGAPRFGVSAPAHHQICAHCFQGFTLQINNRSNRSYGWCKVDHGYHIDGKVASLNLCVCNHGTGTQGRECASHGQHNCASCEFGYDLHSSAGTASCRFIGKVCEHHLFVSNESLEMHNFAYHKQYQHRYPAGEYNLTKDIQNGRPVYVSKTDQKYKKYMFHSDDYWYIAHRKHIGSKRTRGVLMYSRSSAWCPADAGMWSTRLHSQRTWTPIGSNLVSAPVKVDTSLDKATLKVILGHCQVQDHCVQTPNYPSPYDKHEFCKIVAPRVRFKLDHFHTLPGDKLRVNGRDYDGKHGPDNVLIIGPITWSSKGGAKTKGWKLCSSEADHAMGQFHLYHMQDGTVWAAGRNNAGQLGDNTTTDHFRPVKIMSGVIETSMGLGFSLFLGEHGIAYGAGLNDSGQLPSLDKSANASKLSRLREGVAHISAGATYSWFLMTNGTLWSSQSKGEGGGVIHSGVRQISAQGDFPMFLNSSNMSFTRVSLSAPSHPAINVEIADNVHHVATNKGVSLIKNASGVVSGWIDPSCRGKGKITSKGLYTAMTPSMLKKFKLRFQKVFRSSMQQLFTQVSKVVAGPCYAIALKNGGEVWVAGNNSAGQLGVPREFIDWDKPVRVNNVPERIKDVFAGDDFAIFTTVTGKFLASGNNSFGQFGDASTHKRTDLGGCGASNYLASAAALAALGTGFGHMPSGICQFCPPGHFVNVSVQKCTRCPPMLMSKTVIHGLSDCAYCKVGAEPDHHQNGCIIANKMKFLLDQLPTMLAWLAAYFLIIAVVLTCKTWILPRYGFDKFAYKALGDEIVMQKPQRLKSRFWRIIRVPQPVLWPWWFLAGGDFVDWSILLLWYDKSYPSGKLADFEADYNLALATSVLLYFGPFLPLLMSILPRTGYVMVEVVFDCLELLVVSQSGFTSSAVLFWMNVAATVMDLVFLKGPEAIDIVLSEHIPGMTQLFDCCDREGRAVFTTLIKDAGPGDRELSVSPVYELRVGNLIIIEAELASEEHEITDLTNHDDTLVIAIAEPLKNQFKHETLVHRPRIS